MTFTGIVSNCYPIACRHQSYTIIPSKSDIYTNTANRISFSMHYNKNNYNIRKHNLRRFAAAPFRSVQALYIILIILFPLSFFYSPHKAITQHHTYTYIRNILPYITYLDKYTKNSWLPPVPGHIIQYIVFITCL